MDYRRFDYTKPTAIILGAELDGISQDTLDGADGEIKVPMQGMVESLNVSVANAVVLFEAQRQRLRAGYYDTCRLENDVYEKLLFEFAYPEAAKVMRSRGEPYPELDHDGAIVG